MRPYGPSPLINGIFISCSKLNMMMGSVNTSVFPEPVNAMPIISRPDKIAGMPVETIKEGFEKLYPRLPIKHVYRSLTMSTGPVTLDLDRGGSNDSFLLQAFDD